MDFQRSERIEINNISLIKAGPSSHAYCLLFDPTLASRSLSATSLLCADLIFFDRLASPNTIDAIKYEHRPSPNHH
ncbi:unnamed protein product [Zymoseptoria tritici ST99CH_3D7]|uniref:Uncharacterized protein n=1 Tax=Zymoseptoria tritici (strain ST99CH_3D7) TaxID=1276538 RepID=A0A1X7RTR5_ZYMT9|nr:unnamed protein product [Zymoseptoria tritici ST99CH_3D7]